LLTAFFLTASLKTKPTNGRILATTNGDGKGAENKVRMQLKIILTVANIPHDKCISMNFFQRGEVERRKNRIRNNMINMPILNN
jgi:hypothetical protein